MPSACNIGTKKRTLFKNVGEIRRNKIYIEEEWIKATFQKKYP